MIEQRREPMPSRFTYAAMALAAPLLLAACEREAQQQAEVGQPAEPPAAETETAAPAEPQPAAPAAPPEVAEQQPAAPQPGEADVAQPQEGAAEEVEGEVVVVPPEEEAAQAQEEEPPGTQAPGEPTPEAAGVASVAAYVGRWAEELEMCPRAYWTFTNLRLQSPEGDACDIVSTSAQGDDVDLEVACTDRGQPLAEPERGTMSLTFPNLPETDTMTVRGGLLEEEAEELTLSRCPPG
jgi:hypothetical protein